MFVLATLKSVADVTQVAQLGRYYLPVFALMLPDGVAGMIEWVESWRSTGGDCSLARRHLLRLWCGPSPTWAYDASWLAKRFQLHWPALYEAGEWIQAHPEPGSGRRPHHDMVSLGVAVDERPDHDPDAA